MLRWRVSTSSAPCVSSGMHAARTARHGTQTGEQFLHAERLDEVVIGAGIDAIHLLAPAVARRSE